jgi:DNA gyrase/topoisomerase IV subunit B
MLLYNITEMDAPAFDSAVEDAADQRERGKIVQTAMDDPEFFKGVVKRNPEWIESVYQRCRDRTEKKDNKEIAAEAKRNRGKVEKLVDATGMDRRSACCCSRKGDSALSGSMSMRDPKIHGGLPLRGKVLNTTRPRSP